jgi:NADH-quinone oxidoreductase subunit J
MPSFVINISSFICVAAALVVILTRNPVHSVLFLVLSFCSGAVLLLAMGAEFLGLMVLIVYVGAIAVLFLFVVMMLNINLESRGEERKSLILVGSGIVMLMLVFLSLFLPHTGAVPEALLDFQSFGWPMLFDRLNTLETLGQIL